MTHSEIVQVVRGLARGTNIILETTECYCAKINGEVTKVCYADTNNDCIFLRVSGNGQTPRRFSIFSLTTIKKN